MLIKTPKTKKNDSDENHSREQGDATLHFFPVNSSYTMSNLLIDKTAVQDLILGDKGSNIGEGPCRVAQDSQKTFQRGPHVNNKEIF